MTKIFFFLTEKNNHLRFRSDESIEGTGFSCRIAGLKRNETQHPTHPTPTHAPASTTPKPLVCPIPSPEYCLCGRVKHFGLDESENETKSNSNIQTQNRISELNKMNHKLTDLSRYEIIFFFYIDWTKKTYRKFWH